MASLADLRTTAQAWLDKIYNDTSGQYPPSDSEKNKPAVADYVEALYKDSKAWREKSLQQRFRSFNDPVDFWKRCRDLEQGNHWDVWGRRNADAGNEWRHELLDNFIGNQNRVRKSYLTANWHDIIISPNLADINAVIEQEREQTDWPKSMVLSTHRVLIEGTCIFHTIFDRTEDVRGLAKEELLDNESVFPPPYATSFKKRDNCWYLIVASMKNLQQLSEVYPDLDVDKIALVQNDRAREINIQREMQTLASFSKTKFSDHYEVYLDDPTLEKAEFDPADLEKELEMIQNGQAVEPKRGENHAAFIRGYMQIIQNLSNEGNVGDEQDQQFTENFLEYLADLVGERRELAKQEEEEDGIKPGKQKKYPFGRHIVVVGGQVAVDEPNPWEFDWRLLFHKSDCESLPGYFWGRGIAEILWNTNLAADTALSRIADLTVTIGYPKAWMSIEDKETIGQPGEYNNDPTKPGFYTGRPPVFPKGVLPPELFQLYSAFREKATQEIGVNEVTYGEAPSKRSSGKMVQDLIRQNVVLVTGEASSNQNDMIEQMIETRIRLYKILYREPRYYIINGKQVAKRLSAELSKFHTFQVRVKPNSNFPNQWEDELNFAMQMAGTVSADGLPFLPREAVIDIIAKRYPQYGRDGEYYQLSQALQLGLQELKKQQEQANSNRQTQQMIDQKIRGEGVNQIMQHIGGGNGKG
jgi:hypothetical protein